MISMNDGSPGAASRSCRHLWAAAGDWDRSALIAELLDQLRALLDRRRLLVGQGRTCLPRALERRLRLVAPVAPYLFVQLLRSWTPAVRGPALKDDLAGERRVRRLLDGNRSAVRPRCSGNTSPCRRVDVQLVRHLRPERGPAAFEEVAESSLLQAAATGLSMVPVRLSQRRFGYPSGPTGL